MLSEFKDIFTFDKYLFIYVCMVGIDITTGLLKAYKLGNFKSSKMRNGIIKVIAELLSVVFGGLLDVFFDLKIFMISIKLLLVATQGISIIENFSQLEYNIIPSFVKDKLQVVKEMAEKGDVNKWL